MVILQLDSEQLNTIIQNNFRKVISEYIDATAKSAIVRVAQDQIKEATVDLRGKKEKRGAYAKKH